MVTVMGLIITGGASFVWSVLGQGTDVPKSTSEENEEMPQSDVTERKLLKAT